MQWKGETLGILEMRRHYGNYLKGLPDIKHFRTQLVTINDLSRLLEIMDEIVGHYTGFMEPVG